MSLHGRASLVLLLFAAVAIMGYVSPDDQGRSKTGDRTRFEAASPGKAQRLRKRPQPLSVQDELRMEHARQGYGAARKTRDIDTGYASSGAGSASYSGSSGSVGGGGGGVNGATFGYAGFGNPFIQNQANQPFDFNGFFQQLQQIQQSIGQYALNQAAGNFGHPETFGNVDLADLHSNLPAAITLKNGTEIPTSVLLAAFSASRPHASHQHHANNAGAGVFGQGFDNAAFNQIGNNFEGASASASLGPNGGFGSAQLVPDLGNRFGGQSSQSGQFEAPGGGNGGGGNVAIFTSSSAGSSDVNGQRQTYKTATSGVNDNGKITTFTVRDPPQ